MEDTCETVNDSTLCNDCRVLQFDDSEDGGFVQQNSSGEYVLEFDKKNDYGYISDRWGHKQLRLKYAVTDLLPHLPYLKISAERGCTFCGALRNAMLSCLLNRSGKVTFELRYVWSWTYGHGLQQLLVDVQYYTSADLPSFMNTLVFQLDCEPGVWRTWLQTRIASREHSLCLQNMRWIKEELEYCRTNHRCVASASTFWPTRLLDLGTSDTGRDTRLIHTIHDPPGSGTQYAALSYCWGTKEEAENQLTTTSSTLERHCDRIAFDDMTPVIQDAVTAARELSIHYLWIDALCIIQDDVNDWRRESGQMGLVYQHAYITFCTPTSSSCLEGFLARVPAVKIKFCSRLRPSVQGTYNLRYQQIYGLFELSPRSDTTPEWLDISCAGRWITRGWALQEQHLSTRRLYFGCSRIQLHCSKTRSTEPGFKSENDGLFTIFRDQVQGYRQDRNRDLLFYAWNQLVSDYASRSVTNQIDALPAISGLAKIMGAEIDDTYVASLWSNDLPRGLLWEDISPTESWEHLTDRSSSRLLSPYISPSWSWCTHRGYQWPFIIEIATCISYNLSGRSETGFRTECETINAWCVPESAKWDPYGRITCGELHVEGKIRKCDSVWRRTSSLGHFASIERWKDIDSNAAATYSIDFTISKEVNEISVDNVFMLLLASSCGVNTRWSTKWDSYEEARAQEIGSVLNEDSTYTSVEKRNAWGLLIYPITGTDDFIRIGVFRISSEQGGLECFFRQPISCVKII